MSVVALVLWITAVSAGPAGTQESVASSRAAAIENSNGGSARATSLIVGGEAPADQLPTRSIQPQDEIGSWRPLAAAATRCPRTERFSVKVCPRSLSCPPFPRCILRPRVSHEHTPANRH